VAAEGEFVMAFQMPFGRYKGQSITEVPEPALKHYLAWDQLRPETRKYIEAELARRAEEGTAEGAARSAAPKTPGDRPLRSSVGSAVLPDQPGRQRAGHRERHRQAPAEPL
jgi:hypothetical protein